MTEAPSAAGTDHNALAPAQWIAKYDAGERLYLGCGHQAIVAREMLRRAGIRSRLVAALSRSGPFDFTGDGHTFLEVRLKHRWVVYDPDANRQPVDAEGRGLGVVEAVRQRPFRWRYIASDPYCDCDPSFSYDDLDRALDHALGIPLIQMRSGWWAYHVNSAELRRRVALHARITGTDWTHVGERRWRRLRD